MAHCNTTLAQILEIFPRHEFEALSKMYPNEVKMRTFSRWTQFVAMLSAQLAGLDSLRCITDVFDTQENKLYHWGIKKFSRSTLARANNQDSSAKFFKELFHSLLHKCKTLAPANKKFKFNDIDKLYLLDSTIIQLPLSIFSWAKYKTEKGAIKLHIGLNADGYLPELVNMTNATTNDINQAKTQHFSKGSLIVFDRGYNDYHWFKQLTKQNIYFVTRLKSNAIIEDLQKRPGRKSNDVIEDKKVKLKNIDGTFRVVHFVDSDSNEEYKFLTNAHHIPASTVAKLYKERWQVELFFKWIKQHLKIKSFMGTSMNAVQTQIWIALCAYLLVAFLKFQNHLKLSFLHILRKIQANLFERRDLLTLFFPYHPKIPCKIKQLSIFPNL